MAGWQLRQRVLRRFRLSLYRQAGKRTWLALLVNRIRFGHTGTRLAGGSDKPSASMPTKEHGTPTPVTGTTADSNSYSLLGYLSVDGRDLTSRPRVSSSTVPGTFTFVMGGRGVSGVQQGSAG